MSTFALKDHVAIVTGSAQGLGKEFASRLLQDGAKVCISDFNVDLGKKTLQEFVETYGSAQVTFCK